MEGIWIVSGQQEKRQEETSPCLRIGFGSHANVFWLFYIGKRLLMRLLMHEANCDLARTYLIEMSVEVVEMEVVTLTT